MIDHEKALEAAKVLKEYCSERPNCYECIFGTKVDGWMQTCVLVSGDKLVYELDLEEAERICHGSGKGN